MMQKQNCSQAILKLISEISFVIVISIIGGVFGFFSGFFIADFRKMVERRANEWQLLDSSVGFKQIAGANSDMVWSQDADGKLYVWNFNCKLQQKCSQWIETDTMNTGLQYPLAKQDNTCGSYPAKKPPGKIVECGQLNFNLYVLLEDGTIWYWHDTYPGDGLPAETYIFTVVGMILGILVSPLIINRKQRPENK